MPLTWIGGTYRYLTTDYIPSLVVCDEKNNKLFSVRLKEDGYIHGYFEEDDTVSVNFFTNLKDGKYYLYSGYELTDSEETFYSNDFWIHPVSLMVEGDNLTVNNAPDTETEKNYNLFGDKKCFVMLVQFPDVKFSLPNPQEYFHRLCNEHGFDGDNPLYPTKAGHGSVSDYFSAQSDGVFNVSFDVLPVVTVKHNQEYYGADSPVDPKDRDIKIGEMVTEALSAVDGSIDFNNYCWDETKKEVTNFYIVTPGTSQTDNNEYTTLLWPSRRVLQQEYVSGEGIVLKNYAYGTELGGTLLNEKGELDPKLHVDGIGTMCHEFSHCLGFMDHYDSSPGKHGEVQGVGYFDIMGRGCQNGDDWIPAGYSGYERQLASWIDFKELYLDQPEIIENLKPINQGGDCYMVRNPLNYNEFFTIEVREKSGWDACLPDSGLMITYINYNKTRWEYNYVNVVNSLYRYPGIRILSPGLSIDSIYTEPKKLFHEGDSLTNYTDPFSFICTNNPFDKYGRNLHVCVTDIVMNDDGSYSFNWMHCANPSNIQGVVVRREERPVDDAYYSLDGRRLSRKPQQGIYIHRGKKIFIRND
jgi:M6 family metalloprotease-like protein